MKKIVSIFILSFIALGGVVGCVMIRVEKTDGTKKVKYSYSRLLGSQNLEDVSMTMKDGTAFHIGKQNGMNSLDKTFENTSAALRNLSTRVP